MSDPAAFLLARLAEEEADAQVARKAPRWVMESDLPDTWPPTRDHIIRHNPARALRQVAVLRRVVEYVQEVQRASGEPPGFDLADAAALTYIIRALAAIWADHPDYREEWAL